MNLKLFLVELWQPGFVSKLYFSALSLVSRVPGIQGCQGFCMWLVLYLSVSVPLFVQKVCGDSLQFHCCQIMGVY